MTIDTNQNIGAWETGEQQAEQTIEHAIELYDAALCPEVPWDYQRAERIVTETHVVCPGQHGPDLRAAFYDPLFHRILYVNDRHGNTTEVELLKYVVEYRLSDDTKEYQFRRQINLPLDKGESAQVQAILGKPTIVIHEPSPEYPQELPYRFEIGRAKPPNTRNSNQTVLEYRRMRLEREPRSLVNLVRLLSRAVRAEEVVNQS